MKDDAPWQRDEIESPCTKVCVIHPEARICVGCYRTAEEVTDWFLASNREKREILQRARQRMEEANPIRLL